MTTLSSSRTYYLLSALFILLLCFGLFYIDKDTKSIADLFKPGNLVALMLYFFPVWLLCFLLYSLFRTKNQKHRAAMALGIGIPVGFAAVIRVLSYLMGRL